VRQVDMDGDGETDLVAGAPGVRGCVHILLGAQWLRATALCVQAWRDGWP
jgi:hypothetical protein